MNVKFKDGKKIKFQKFGKIWLADSVILEETKLNGSVTELRELKAKVAEWFKENAPEDIREKYNVRFPLWKEFKALPFKDRFAYKEGRTDKIAEYFLGDEDNTYPVYCFVGGSNRFGWFCCYADLGWSYKYAVRLCLEEKE